MFARQQSPQVLLRSTLSILSSLRNYSTNQSSPSQLYTIPVLKTPSSYKSLLRQSSPSSPTFGSFSSSHISSSFRQTTTSRDWHQKVDNKTGKFYYLDIFTGQKSEVQPKMFLPYDAPRESAAMAILRQDRTDASGATAKKSVLRPLITVGLIAGGLYVAGEMGWLDSLFGFEPPPKLTVTTEQRVIDRANSEMKSFLDRQRGV